MTAVQRQRAREPWVVTEDDIRGWLMDNLISYSTTGLDELTQSVFLWCNEKPESAKARIGFAMSRMMYECKYIDFDAMCFQLGIELTMQEKQLKVR